MISSYDAGGDRAVSDTRNRGDRQFVTFYLGEGLYALPIDAVKGVVNLGPITPIPHADPCVEGFMNLRGTVLKVIDGGRWIGHGTERAPAPQKIVVVQHGGTSVGLAVDRMARVVRVRGDESLPMPVKEADRYEGLFMMQDVIVRVLNEVRLCGLPAAHGEVVGAQTAVLHRMVRKNAPAEEEEQSGKLLLRFDMNGEAYALAAERVRDIAPLPEQLETVHGWPSYVLGLGVYRNRRILPIVNLSQLLFGRITGRPQRVICVQADTPEGPRLIGLAVDRVSEVRRVKERDSIGVPGALASFSAYIQDVYQVEKESRPWFLLDAGALLERVSEQAVLPYDAAVSEGNAPEEDEGKTSGSERQLYLFFRVQGQEFGIPAASIREITKNADITPVPLASRTVAGLVNIRGRTVTAVSASAALGLSVEAESAKHLIVTEVRGAVRCIAVQETTRVLEVVPERPNTNRSGGFPFEQQRLLGFHRNVGGQLVPLLDPKLFYER